ncbi:hypothetical protein EIK77_005121 [Talaromyces pinophilus]|nr:hypothetical protein EIK77_005121 [Talaromyces pinophilus]
MNANFSLSKEDSEAILSIIDLFVIIIMRLGAFFMLCRLASFIPIVNGAAVTNATTFQVFQQKNPNFVKNASAIHYADLARYNTTLNSTYGVAAVATVAAGSALTLGQAGTTPAIGVLLESEYVCPVTIGGQTLFLDFDTGSSDL